MWVLLAAALVAALFLAFYGVTRQSMEIRLIALLSALVGAACLGYAFGAAWERMRCQDRYIYSFSKYSRALCRLAQRGQLSTLTNAIIRFDSTVQPGFTPSELQRATKVVEDEAQ